MRVSILFLTCLAALGQTPEEQTLLEKQAELPSVVRSFLVDHPNAAAHYRSERAMIYKVAARKYEALFGRDMAYVDEDGHLQEVRPEVWRTDQGWMIRGGRAVTVVAKAPSGTNYWLGIFARNSRQTRKGFALRLGSTVTRSGATIHSGNWHADLRGGGFEIRSGEIAASVGQTAFSTTYRTFGGVTLEQAADGGLHIGPLAISRAVMLGADGVRYPCSAWQFNATTASFACDDTDLPSEAYPYVIDPTANYDAGASGDDAFIQKLGCTSWYGATCDSPTANTSGSFLELKGLCVYGSWSTGSGYRYGMSQMFLRFDTSGLDDAATITSAKLYMYMGYFPSPVGTQTFWAEWINSSIWPITTSDWDDYPGSDAASFTMSSWSGYSWRSISLDSASTEVSKTGYTALMLAPAKTDTPSSDDTTSAGFNSYDYGSNEPYLSVSYTLGGPMVITASDND